MIGAAAQVGGAILKGFGTWNETQMQVRGYEQRAQILDWDAEAVKKRGDYEASQITLEGRRLRARQLVQYAKSGVLMEGTPNLVRAETKMEVDRDAAFTADTAARQAGTMRVQAAYERWMAASAKIGGIFSVLGGVASSAYNISSSIKNAGSWSNWWHT